MQFEEFGLIEPLLKALAFEGYIHPTPIQERAIPPVLLGCDLLGCAQTGTGKTAAFALPILQRLAQTPADGHRPIRALVVSPTRELAAQIGESFAAYGRHVPVRETVIYGGVPQRAQAKALKQGVDVLVATPGRLMDLMHQGLVKLDKVEVFVLDEADRMLDMGFIADIRRIVATLPQRRQTLMFSATMPNAIMSLAHSILREPVDVRVTPNAPAAELVQQSVYFVERPHKQALLEHLLSQPNVKRALVFTRTKHGADRVARRLSLINIKAEAIHSDRTQGARLRTLDNFRKGRSRVLVASDILSRGLDVDDITHVINFDVPNQPETYVHRIGRTGRAGATGLALSLCDIEERAYLDSIERLVAKPLEVISEHPFVSAVPRKSPMATPVAGARRTIKRNLLRRRGRR